MHDISDSVMSRTVALAALKGWVTVLGTPDNTRGGHTHLESKAMGIVSFKVHVFLFWLHLSIPPALHHLPDSIGSTNIHLTIRGFPQSAR